LLGANHTPGGNAVQRLIDGPERDWLSAEQVCEYLGVGETRFRELLDAGLFPAPVTMGERDRLPRWHWLDVTSYMHLRSRFLPALSGRAVGPSEASGSTSAGNKRRQGPGESG
jgi:excisionase family DNA binding protein